MHCNGPAGPGDRTRKGQSIEYFHFFLISPCPEGSYPFPGWLEFACQHLDQFGDADRAELIDDAVAIAICDQVEAVLDVITDGKQMRLDFNLSCYAFTEALLPIVRAELEALVKAGCRELTVDEPSMNCYAHREDPKRFVDLFNRTVEPVVGRCRLSTHLCFGNFKGRAVGLRRYAPMFPAFLDMPVDEIHVEMASREFAELELIGRIAQKKDVAVGIMDVKSYYVETVDDVAARVRMCLKFAPADRLSFAPDCGLSQTARWAARQKLKNMVAGVHGVRKEI